MEPTLTVYPTEVPPTGNLLARGLNTLLVQRKLPYRLSSWSDRLLRALGRTHRTVQAGGHAFHTRRGVWADESIIRHVVTEREYNPPGYEIGPDDVVIDVGANIGAFSVTAAAAATTGQVFAFEPEPNNFATLRRNLTANGCGNVTAFRLAVSDLTATLTLNVNPNNTGGHSLTRRHGDDTVGVSVPVIPFRQVFDDHRIDRCDFLKMDCEGAEYDILFGLPDEYYPRIRRLVMEYHLDTEDDRRPAERLVRHLQDRGFVIDTYTRIVGGRGGLLFAHRPDSFAPSRKPR